MQLRLGLSELTVSCMHCSVAALFIECTNKWQVRYQTYSVTDEEINYKSLHKLNCTKHHSHMSKLAADKPPSQKPPNISKLHSVSFMCKSLGGSQSLVQKCFNPKVQKHAACQQSVSTRIDA